MNKLLALAVAAATAASADAFAAETTCTAAPSCASLGYTQTTSACSGKYIVCPFDASKVTCLNDGPHVGDLKHSLYYSNHDGWLKCDGSQYSRTSYAKLYSVINTSFCSVRNGGCSSGMFAVPDYRGFFLRGYSNPSSSTTTYQKYSGSWNYSTSTPQKEQLPNIRGEVKFTGVKYASSSTSLNPGALSITNSGNKWGDDGGKGTASAGLSFNASSYNPIYNGSNVIPANYGTYIFIYAGE